MSKTKKAVNLSLREKLFKELQEKGFRMTPQRETIFDVFYGLTDGEHLSAEELYQALQDKKAEISLATAYRTLKLFVSAGILRELDFSEDHKHYELIHEDEAPHHHIICVDCGKTAEFESPEVQALAEKIAREKNLQLIDVQLKIFANCLNTSHDISFQDHHSMKE